MIQNFIFLTISVLCVQVTSVHSLPNLDSDSKCTVSVKATNEAQKELEAINTRIEQFYIKENVNSLINLYAGQFTFSPEYKKAVLDYKTLKKFYSGWFKLVDIKAYKKQIHTVEAYSDYVLEIGVFRLNYSSVSNSPGEYMGKYMILWKRESNGNLNIISETFGADKYIEPEDVPYAGIQVQESHFVAKHTINNKLYEEIEAFNNEVIKAVAEGDAETRINGFTEDVILLENFESILVGKESIKPVMLKRYKPGGTSYTVKHTYYRIYDLGKYIFINGHYKGSWGDSINGGGRFEGNMSNLMKRNEHGVLKMYRQAGNRDSGIEMFGN